MYRQFINRIVLPSLFVFVPLQVWAECANQETTGRYAIHAAAEDAQPLMPGMMAPEFTVMDPAGAPVEFNPASLDQPVIMTFYRGGWCPYCNLHLAEMQEVEQKVKAMGYDIWFISVDQPSVLAESLDEPDLEYQVLSDSDLCATRAFGVAFKIPDELVERYLNYDIDIEGASGREHHVLPVPSTFIIGTDGIIKFAYSNPNYKVRLPPEVLEAAATVHATDVDDRLQKQLKALRESD
ncbi:MAG TPA: peroxiredoxin-like family protein [Xanthomonadales bacterium]|nr:peroxiredoxin-like family protein [Xanthomonadales bacterium]